LAAGEHWRERAGKGKTHSKNNQNALDLSLANRKLSRNGVLGGRAYGGRKLAV
jgi:hypothetical protein